MRLHPALTCSFSHHRLPRGTRRADVPKFLLSLFTLLVRVRVRVRVRMHVPGVMGIVIAMISQAQVNGWKGKENDSHYHRA